MSIKRCKDCKQEITRFGDRCLFCEHEFETKEELEKKDAETPKKT